MHLIALGVWIVNISIFSLQRQRVCPFPQKPLSSNGCFVFFLFFLSPFFISLSLSISFWASKTSGDNWRNRPGEGKGNRLKSTMLGPEDFAWKVGPRAKKYPKSPQECLCFGLSECRKALQKHTSRSTFRNQVAKNTLQSTLYLGKEKTTNIKKFGWKPQLLDRNHRSRRHSVQPTWNYTEIVPGRSRCLGDSLPKGHLQGTPTTQFLHVFFVYRFFSLFTSWPRVARRSCKWHTGSHIRCHSGTLALMQKIPLRATNSFTKTIPWTENLENKEKSILVNPFCALLKRSIFFF